MTASSFDERLDDARFAMKEKARETPLGPWTAVTDAPAKDLEPLARVAAHIAEGFAERYGLTVAPPGEQAVASLRTSRITGFPRSRRLRGARVTRVAAST